MVFKDGEVKMLLNGMFEWWFMFVLMQEWEILDMWYMMGLCGIVSNDYMFFGEEMFVLREYIFSFLELKCEGVLWVKFDMFLRKMLGILFGVVCVVFDFVIDMLKDKVEMLVGWFYNMNL